MPAQGYPPETNWSCPPPVPATIQRDDVNLFELYRSPAAPSSQVPSPRWYLLSGQRTLVSPTPPSRRYQRTGDSPTTGHKRYSRPHVRTHSVALHHPLCLPYMIPCTGSPEADSAGSSPSRLTVDMNMNTIYVVVINHYECHKLQAFSRIRNYNISPIGFRVCLRKIQSFNETTA